VQDGGVDDDDVSHRDEGGETCQGFGAPRRFEACKLEVVFQLFAHVTF
jgi:hypothetical protein